MFRERLSATEDATSAALQTKTLLDLDPHREDIRQTLVTLGTYSQALETGKASTVRSSKTSTTNDLQILAEGAEDLEAAEMLIREQLGEALSGLVSREDVLLPLSNAAHRARSGDAAGAIQAAGNAVETFLVEVASRVEANIKGAHGINAKAARLKDHWTLPDTLLNISKYLGHVRNAADHGHDTQINAAWDVSASTGTNYVFVACAFIVSLYLYETEAAPTL